MPLQLGSSCSISEMTRRVFIRESFYLAVAGFELLFIAADKEEFAACYSQKWSTGSAVRMRKTNVNKRSQHAKKVTGMLPGHSKLK